MTKSLVSRAVDILEDVMEKNHTTPYRINCLFMGNQNENPRKVNIPEWERKVNHGLASRSADFRVILKRKNARICIITKRGIDEV